MNWFLRKLNKEDADTIASARLLLTLTVVAFTACLTFIPIFFFLAGRPLGIYSTIVTPFVGMSALVLRWTGSVRFAAHYYVAIAWVYITGALVLLGGADSAGPLAYYLLVLAATFMISRQAGIVWTGLLVVSVVAAEIATRQFGITPPTGVDQQAALSTLAHVANLTMLCIFALKSYESKTTVLQELRSNTEQTTRMISQLEVASNRLLSSSVQLLGSKQDRSQGLVGQMMQRAQSGRQTIEEAKLSIEGMIEQYRHISAHVQDLHRHSQIIIELVSTIDRISSRLDIMALNVGIEAAQSGEGAKQFSIIAQDMRLLAERVLNETTRIKSSLQSVNARVDKVLQSSAEGQDLTTESAARMTDMVSTFDEIFALIADAEGKTGQITEDTLSQLKAVRRVVTAAEGKPMAS